VTWPRSSSHCAVFLSFQRPLSPFGGLGGDATQAHISRPVVADREWPGGFGLRRSARELIELLGRKFHALAGAGGVTALWTAAARDVQAACSPSFAHQRCAGVSRGLLDGHCVGGATFGCFPSVLAWWGDGREQLDGDCGLYRLLVALCCEACSGSISACCW